MCTITCEAPSICSTPGTSTSARIPSTYANEKLLNNADLKDKNEEAHQRVVEDAKNYGQMIKANMKGGMGYYPSNGLPGNLANGGGLQNREGDFFIPQPNNFTTDGGRNEEQDDVFYN